MNDFIESAEELSKLKTKKSLNAVKFRFICYKCNRECMSRLRNILSFPIICSSCKRKETSLKKYGAISATLTEEAQAKRRATCLKKYGTDCVLRLDRIKDAAKNKTAEEKRIIREKREKTMIERYVRRVRYVEIVNFVNKLLKPI